MPGRPTSSRPRSSPLAELAARLRSLSRGLRRRAEIEGEMSEEFRHHIELRAADLERQGLSAQEAARRARIEFGSVESLKEDARASRGLHLFDEVRFSWLDVKLGLRMLTKYPGLTLVALFALAVGIPVGMAPMHLARVVEAPLPEDHQNRVRALRYWDTATRGLGTVTSYELSRWSEELQSFELLGATRTDMYNVVLGEGEGASSIEGAAAVLGAEVTASVFGILRARPSLGRAFGEADEVVGAPEVAIVGHDLWQSRLAGDPRVLGRTVRIAGVAHTIVGVMPKGFLFPVRQQLWLPMREEIATVPGEGLGLRLIGRLAEGVSSEDAHAELAAVSRRITTSFPDSHAHLEGEVVPFPMSFMGIPRGGLDNEPGFYFFQLLGLLLLLVACANVALLIFARTATRFRELAVRSALGASRLRVLSQMFAESLVIAVLAAGLGILLADFGLDRCYDYALGRGAPLPYWLDLGVSQDAIAWALGLAVLSAIVAGVLPALRVTRAQLSQSIQHGRAGTTGIRFGGLTGALVVADVAIAVVVVGLVAGLSDHLLDQTRIDDRVGIPAEQYLSAELRLPRNESAAGTDDYDPRRFTTRLAATQQTLLDRLRAEPGVRGVAAASALPRMDHSSLRVVLPDEATSGETEYRSVRSARVDLDFFAAFEHPIRAGRGFDWADVSEHARTVIVNTSFVDLVLDGRNPIGQRIRFLPWGPSQGIDRESDYEIVGVVGSLGINVVHSQGDPGVYFPAAPGEIHPLRLAVHVAGDPEAFTPRLRELVGEVDPTAVLSDTRSLDRVHQGDWYLMVALTGGLVLLLGILIALAASGIFAMVSFGVTERTTEIGIRAALGAQNGAILSMVLRRSLTQMAVGALVGGTVTFLLVGLDTFGGWGQGLAFTLAAGTAVVALVGLAACTAPALRALRVEPTEALRGLD